MSEKVELLIDDCRALLFPDRPGEEEGTIHAASVAVADGKIVAVGAPREMAGRYAARTRVDAAGRLLTPGFVDSHTHLVFAGDRSGEYARRLRGATYEEIAAAGGGIRATVRATRAASEDDLVRTARPRIERMLAAGTTTIEIKSGYGLDLETELKMLRAIRRLGRETPARLVPTFLGAHETPDEHRSDRAAYIDLVCEEMIPRVAAEKLAVFCDVFCETGVFTASESRRVLECGKRAGLRPKIHADEFALSGGSAVAADVGAVSADHLMQTDDAGIAGLARAGVVPVLLPGTTFFLHKKQYAPARRLLDASLPVALATDRNAGSSTIESMPLVLGLACAEMAMTPLEAFAAATLHGARAVGLEREVGRIAPGFAADLVLWEAASLEGVLFEFTNVVPRTVFTGGTPLDGHGKTPPAAAERTRPAGRGNLGGP